MGVDRFKKKEREKKSRNGDYKKICKYRQKERSLPIKGITYKETLTLQLSRIRRSEYNLKLMKESINERKCRGFPGHCIFDSRLARNRKKFNATCRTRGDIVSSRSCPHVLCNRAQLQQGRS